MVALLLNLLFLEAPAFSGFQPETSLLSGTLLHCIITCIGKILSCWVALFLFRWGSLALYFDGPSRMAAGILRSSRGQHLLSWHFWRILQTASSLDSIHSSQSLASDKPVENDCGEQWLYFIHVHTISGFDGIFDGHRVSYNVGCLSQF